MTGSVINVIFTSDVPGIPDAKNGERPTDYAGRLGEWFGRRIDEAHRKSHGHYLTPAGIARLMGSLSLSDRTGETVRLLDPAAGAGVLAAAACEALADCAKPPKRIELVAYEIDVGLRGVLERCFAYLSDWLAARGIELSVRLELCDFVLKNAGVLEGGILPYEGAFDAVICNPPYFKLPKSDPRAQACLTVVYGQPNLYGLFMALSAALLCESGRFVFITPRSYASGPYFRCFRQWFFARIRPTELHTFGSRTEAFDEVLQETVITAATRQSSWQSNRRHTVRLSASAGASDLAASSVRELPLKEVLRGDCNHQILYLPASQADDEVRRIVQGWKGSLGAYGWAVSTGPVVAFRCKDFLLDRRVKTAVPLLWLQHVHAMEIRWPLDTRKAQFIVDAPSSQHVLVPNSNYVIMRRFSAKEEKRRLTATPYIARRYRGFRHVGIENHLNYIYRSTGRQFADNEAFGLAALLNSTLMDNWFRIGSGNTQVSATELRAMPLPPLARIIRIGEKVRASRRADIDEIIFEELGYRA